MVRFGTKRVEASPPFSIFKKTIKKSRENAGFHNLGLTPTPNLSNVIR